MLVTLGLKGLKIYNLVASEVILGIKDNSPEVLTE